MAVASDNSGIIFQIDYNATLPADGIISLRNVSTQTTVSCPSNGTIRIQYPETVPVGNLQVMYTMGSTLVLDRQLFSNCNIAIPFDFGDEADEDSNL